MNGVPATSSPTVSKRQPRLVMVVDDDQHHLLFHTMLLQRFEYRVCTARNVAEAITMIEQTVPSLLIIELGLPLMGAFDLIDRVRRSRHTSRMPFIALIEDGDQGAEDRCLRAGFTACLRKPVGAEELYRVVQSAVEPVPRENLRIHAKLPVSVNNVPLDCVEGECASVISEHGMYIRTLRPHPPKSRLSVRIALNGRTISADAVVLYSHRFGEGPYGEPGMGIKFARIAPHDQEHLRSYIHSHVADAASLRA